MKIDKEILGCLSHLKADSKQARRLKTDDEETLDEIMDPYLVDGDVKILCSKGFRKLSDKTQVLTNPWNGLVRNRSSHTMEVVSVASTISSILGLNLNLTRAIAAGHDIGHTPLGHVGEEYLSKKAGKKFRHEVFGVVLAQRIERKGDGLNLTHQTLSGIYYHSRGSGELVVCEEMSQEAAVVMFADKIAYTTADFNDICTRLSLPDRWINPIREKINLLGENQRTRVSLLIKNLCFDSKQLGRVGFGDSPAGKIFGEVKTLMYGVYSKTNIHRAEDALDRIYCYLEKMFGNDKALLILALMTDNDILSLADKNVFDISDLELTSVWEQIKYILDLTVDVFDPGLNW